MYLGKGNNVCKVIEIWNSMMRGGIYERFDELLEYRIYGGES